MSQLDYCPDERPRVLRDGQDAPLPAPVSVFGVGFLLECRFPLQDLLDQGINPVVSTQTY